MKTKKFARSMMVMLLAAAMCFGSTACSRQQESDTGSNAAVLSIKALSPKQVDENPYMANSDANIHHDGYNTDTTDQVLPIGIYPEINVFLSRYRDKNTYNSGRIFTIRATAMAKSRGICILE